jgi:hypothetical protein
MEADGIEKCNEQWFQGSVDKPTERPVVHLNYPNERDSGASSSKYEIQWQYCKTHAEECYIETKPEKCALCGSDPTGDLPRICESCHSLFQRFDRWKQGSHNFGEGALADDQGQDEKCDMCQILRTVGDQYPTSYKDGDKRMYQFTSNGINLLGTPFAIMDAYRSIVSYRPLVSWVDIRQKLSLCEVISRHEPSEREIQTMRSLDIWLIDVDSSRIVRMSDAEDDYAALSYVWGGPQPMLLENNLNQMQLPGALDHSTACSQTIRDAVTVCRRTGVRYLWVSGRELFFIYSAFLIEIGF